MNTGVNLEHRFPSWATPVLVAGSIILLPVGRMVELPLLILAVYGIVASVRHFPEIWLDRAIRVWAALFLLLWIPILTALPDAENVSRSASNAGVFLRYLFVGIGLITLIRDRRQIDTSLTLIGWILTLWVMDASVQALLGRNLLGYPEIAGLLTGVFHPNQKLGHVLAILLPLYGIWLAGMARRQRLVWLLLPLYCVIILLSGKRSAWLMMGFSLFASGLYVLVRLSRTQRMRAGALALAVALTTGVGALTYQPFQEKIMATLGVFSTDFEHIDKATSNRATIWRVATRMAKDHWINGVGTRGFRYAYPHYAEAGDVFMSTNSEVGPTHPHQITLEIAAETGLVGLAGFGVLWIWILVQARRKFKEQQSQPLAWLIAFATAMLPINTGHALYGNFLSALALFLLAAYFASTRTGPSVDSPADMPAPT